VSQSLCLGPMHEQQHIFLKTNQLDNPGARGKVKFPFWPLLSMEEEHQCGTE
jgi:hypothetical protein